MHANNDRDDPCRTQTAGTALELRVGRALKDWVTLADLDVEIHFVKENEIASRNSRSSEKFMHGMKVLMAKNFVDNLSEENSKGMLEKARSGIYPSCAPVGYRNATWSFPPFSRCAPTNNTVSLDYEQYKRCRNRPDRKVAAES
jgi:hypothetical protein